MEVACSQGVALDGEDVLVFGGQGVGTGRVVAVTGSWDGSVRVWDLATGRSLADVLPFVDAVRAVALAHDDAGGVRVVVVGFGGVAGLRLSI